VADRAGQSVPKTVSTRLVPIVTAD